MFHRFRLTPKAVRRSPEPRRSIFDIVYPTTRTALARRSNPLVPKDRPVNFLYMGLFLRFKKHRSQFLTYA
jgi:hypothetical protein